MRELRQTACVLLLLAGVACADDAAPPATAVDDYRMPVPSPLDVGRGIPLDDASFAIDARDVSYVHRDGVLRIPELRLRDVRPTGSGRGATLLPTRVSLDAPGRPHVEGTISGRAVSDARGRLRFDALVALGGSSVAADGALEGDTWNAVVRLDPLVLADVHPFIDQVPSRGLARGALTVLAAPGRLRASTRGLRITGDSSRIDIRGAIDRRGGLWSFHDVRVDLDPVHPDDWRAWLGSAPPIDAPVRGFILAHGDGRAGIDASGSILAESDDGSRLTADVEGRLWLEPRPRLDVTVESRALQLADRGPLDLDIRLSGHADSLAVLGSFRLSDTTDDAVHRLLHRVPRPIAQRLGDATLEIDARVTRDGELRRIAGTARLHDESGRVLAAARGSAPLGGDGAIEVAAHVDSLPLTLLPLPEQIEDFSGFVVASADVSGQLDAVSVDARVDLHAVRFEVPEFGTGVDSMTAGLRLAGDRIELVDARAYRAGGTLALGGGVTLAGPLDLRDPGHAFEGARLDMRATLDTMAIVDMDSARAVVAGELHATGALTRPHVEGTIAIVDGFAYEGKLAPNPPVDPAAPPYDDLIATAPWPATRLRDLARADRAAETGDAPPPFTANVAATITPDFRIIDEDSDLGVSGAVRIVVDERGATAEGDAAILDGFYAYYGELFRLTGGAFAVTNGTTQLAMSGILRDDYRPLGLGQGGASGFDRRDPPIGIFGFSTPATVLELLRRTSALPATQAELASLLLFDVPLQPIDAWQHDLVWRVDDEAELVAHRSAIQGAGLAWSYVADELYDYVPIEHGYMRAGTLRVGSRYPGWIMLGTQLEAGINLRRRFTLRATHVVAADALPGIGLRYAFRQQATTPADRHVELFDEPRFAATLGTRRDDVDVRRRTGIRLRWRWDW